MVGTNGMDMGDMTGWMNAWMAVWGLVGFALLTLAGFAIVWLIRHNGAGSPSRDPQSEPYEILKRRYAAGEIDEDEYRRRRAGLSA